MRLSLLGLALALLVAVGAFVAGYDGGSKTASPNPIRLEHGIPIGVVDTPAGAVAAADNYLVSEDDALLSRVRIRAVISAVWASDARSAELSQPFPTAARLAKPATFPGLRLTAAVAATRIESYTPQASEVRVWHEITLWSPTIEPTQRWELDTVTLVWSMDRWLIASRSSTPDRQTPVPAWTSGGPADRTSQAFDARLVGMSGPYYGGS
jgi:hypothetical protein